MKKIYNPVITLVYTFNCFDIQFQYIFYKLRNYKYIRFPCHFPFFKWFVRQLSRAFRAQIHKDHLSLYTFIQSLDSTYDCSSLKFLLFSFSERRSRRWIITRWTSYSVSWGDESSPTSGFVATDRYPLLKRGRHLRCWRNITSGITVITHCRLTIRSTRKWWKEGAWWTYEPLDNT